MEIEINNNQFKKLFLEQINKVSDKVVLTLENSVLNCIACTPDNSIILSCDFPVKTDPTFNTVINVGDVKKLTKAFDCIEKDIVSFKLSNNNITYSDTDVQFKYHLLEDGIVLKPKINVKKLQDLDFDFEFNITDKVFYDLIKASTFSSDSNKIYISTDKDRVIGSLTDKTRFNIDSFTINVADEYKGISLDSLCLNFEVFRILSTLKINSINCKVCSKLGVVLFSFENNIINMKFIVSALTK